MSNDATRVNLASENADNVAVDQANDIYLAELLQRLCALVEVSLHTGSGSGFSSCAANWLRIHLLLVRIHEGMGSDPCKSMLDSLIVKLDLETTVLETLFGSTHTAAPTMHIH